MSRHYEEVIPYVVLKTVKRVNSVEYSGRTIKPFL